MGETFPSTSAKQRTESVANWLFQRVTNRFESESLVEGALLALISITHVWNAMIAGGGVSGVLTH